MEQPFQFQSTSGLLSVDGTHTRCHTNATRRAQGVAVLNPVLPWNAVTTIRVKIHAKPGRMCYFIGLTRGKLEGDIGESALRQRTVAMENLFGSMHCEKPSHDNAVPCFHTGSVVTMTIDLDPAGQGVVDMRVDTTAATRHCRLPGPGQWRLFVSLYNRGAHFEVEQVQVAPRTG